MLLVVIIVYNNISSNYNNTLKNYQQLFYITGVNFINFYIPHFIACENKKFLITNISNEI